MEQFKQKNGVSVRAYKGDAMTLVAFDLIETLRKNLAGFTICYSVTGNTAKKFIYNRVTFPDDVIMNSGIPTDDRNSTLYSPIQKFNWVHVPNTNIDTQNSIFGDYVYEITPRYIIKKKLQPIDSRLTVKVKINVGPFETKNTKVGFTRGFVSSVAYAKRFNASNNSVRPDQTTLIFPISQTADYSKRWDEGLHQFKEKPYTYQEQHKWLGWQARERILEFLNEVVSNSSLRLKVLAYDLDEPEICRILTDLGKEGRVKIILDDAGDHADPNSFEGKFHALFDPNKSGTHIVRGHYKGLAHCKIFIMLDAAGKAVKALTGSANFSTNGLYINSNHALVFNDEQVAECYNVLFDKSFSSTLIDSLKGNTPTEKDYDFSAVKTPKMTITFAPHKKADAERIFSRISSRITKNGNTDILFAIMKDTSKSSILKAVQQQLKNQSVFTYGITDTISKKAPDYEVFLYKPNNVNGIRVAGKGIANVLPPPFGTVPKVDGYAVHHKFVVVNFKGEDPVVYCGSSNLAFGPEQSNGDNLLEIHDKDIVTAFAIEALRLVDHFHWRNSEVNPLVEKRLDDLSVAGRIWYKPWFEPSDLRNRQRKLYIRP